MSIQMKPRDAAALASQGVDAIACALAVEVEPEVGQLDRHVGLQLSGGGSLDHVLVVLERSVGLGVGPHVLSQLVEDARAALACQLLGGPEAPRPDPRPGENDAQRDA